MAMKFDLIKALAAGVISTYKTDDKDTFIMVIASKGKDAIIIPLMKHGTSYIACFDSAKYDDSILIDYSPIVSEVFAKRVYKDSGMVGSYNPLRIAVPAHNHNIAGFVKTSGVVGNENADAKSILEANGYIIPKKELKTAFSKRDYSELMSDPANKAIFEQDAAELVKVGATYEGLDQEIKTAYEAVEVGSSGGIIFEGPTGTGKSFAARILAHHAGAPLLNLQITYGTTIEDLVGMFIPCDDASGAKWKFVMGPLLKAYVYGYQIVIEEINYGQPGVNAKLNEFTDGTPRVTINGITYNKHPNFVVYMTMNPGYEGTEPLNVALKNRFAKVDVPALTKKEFCKRAQAYSRGLGHELKSEFFGTLFDFAGVIEKEAATSKWHENVKFSIRNAQRVCDAVLQKTRSFEEFQAIIANQYLNDLSTDNDNSEKLQDYKKDKDIVEKIRSIYEHYDFASSKTVKVTTTWEDLFVEAPDYSADHEEKKDAMKKRLDGVASRFGI